MGVAADGYHGQRCIHNSAFTKLRHDGIETLLHDVIRDGVGLAWRQQRGLSGAARTIPDLLIQMDNRTFLCDITVSDTLQTPTWLPQRRGRVGWRRRRRRRR